MVKSFYVIFSLLLIGFVRNPQIIDNNNAPVAFARKIVTVVFQYITVVNEETRMKTSEQHLLWIICGDSATQLIRSEERKKTTVERNIAFYP